MKMRNYITLATTDARKVQGFINWMNSVDSFEYASVTGRDADGCISVQLNHDRNCGFDCSIDLRSGTWQKRWFDHQDATVHSWTAPMRLNSFEPVNS